MRQLILGSIAATTFFLVVGCGTKRTAAPPAATADNNATESKQDADHKPPAPATDSKPAKKLEAKLEATWDGKLHYYAEPASAVSKTATPPPTNCAVAGRVRLFAADQEKPQEADGTLTVMLLDCTPQTGFEEPLLVYEWRIEADSLKTFLAEKTAGPEYAFVLPWDSYKKEITQVRLDVKYEPKTGPPLLTKSDVLMLDHSEMKEHGGN